MRTILRIMKSELRILFFSPVAWMLLIVFAFQVGVEFCGSLDEIIRSEALGYRPYNLSLNLIAGRSGIVSSMLNNLYLYIPLLTMGLMSRELGSGSIKLLYSSPVSNFQIIVGKYLSAIAYSLVLIFILLVPFFYTVFAIKDPDIPVMLTALFGLFLTVSAYAAIGLFMSTVTKYQVIAAVGTLALLAVLNYIGRVGQDIDILRNVTYWLSINGRSAIFIEGMICTKDMFYFILLIFLFLSLSIIKLSGERRKLSIWNSITKYTILVLSVVTLGYISSRPGFIYYYDATATKSNTLAVESQEVMKRIEGEITITTYSNVLDESWGKCTPNSRNYDLKNFEKYLRFRPDIRVEYLFYWGKGTNKFMKERYPDYNDEQLFKSTCESNDYNPKRFISEKDIKDDLSQDNGGFVRTIKSSNGRVAYLRKYDDSFIDPFESEITAAFKTLVDKSPVIAFVTGHNERSCYDHGNKGYGPFATNVGFRYALINQGFTVKELTLSNAVPQDIDVMVIADMKAPMTPEEEANFDTYLNSGGNLLILGEPRRQVFMNPVIAKLGLKFSEGIIVSPSREYTDEIVAARIMPSALSVSKYFNEMITKNYRVITPSATTVTQIENKGFTVTEILASDEKGSWIEYETTDFMNEKSTINPAKDEVEQSNSIMLHLTRKIGEKDQRIFVVGDADCLSSYELTKSRAGLNGDNFSMITEIFRNFSYNEYPIETTRSLSTDDKIYVNETGLGWTKLFMQWVLPIILLVFSILLWWKRKSR